MHILTLSLLALQVMKKNLGPMVCLLMEILAHFLTTTKQNLVAHPTWTPFKVSDVHGPAQDPGKPKLSAQATALN